MGTSIGIVGAEGAKFTETGEAHAREIIRGLLSAPDCTLVSGHCHLGGIDIWAEEIAFELHRPQCIYPAPAQQWGGPGGYKVRNLEIAHASAIVHCIVADTLPNEYGGMRFKSCYHCGPSIAPHVKSGGCWTMLRAKRWVLHIVPNYHGAVATVKL